MNPPKSATTTATKQPNNQPFILEQLQTILLAAPPQIETLRDLLQHMKHVIADVVAAPT